jgi:xylulokinase
MEEQNLIGVDVGTASVRAGVANLAGDLLGVEGEPLDLITHGKDHIEQDPDEMLSTAVRVIKRVLDKTGVKPNSILGISFDGQMAGIMGVDRDFRPATPYDSWLDTRCAPYVELMRERAGREVSASAGAYPSINHGPKMLWWKEEHPEVFGRIHKFIQPAAYVAGRLAGLKGEEAFIDYTYLHFSGFAQTEKGEWNTDLTRLFSFPVEKLPRVVSPMERVGSVIGEFASETDLLEGTPILAGCGDTIASMTGAGVIEPGQAFDVAGTASVFSVCVDSFTPDTLAHTLMTARSVFPGVYYAYAYINGGGMCLDWFRKEFTEEEDQLEALNQQAEAVPPGSLGLLFLPHLAGRVCPGNPEYRGLWQGFGFSHKKAHFYRSILEGVAYEYATYLNHVRRLHPDLRVVSIRGVGGGSQSPQWNQIKSSVLSLPYQNLKTSECGVIGSAFLAGLGVGAISDPGKAIGRFVLTDQDWDPIAQQATVYAKMVPVYTQLLETSGAMHRLIHQLAAQDGAG